MVFRGCFPFVRSLIPKEKDSKKDSEDTYRINPSFKRVTITAKNNNRAVSDMLGIEDTYTKFCIDEVSDYLYQQLLKEERLKNQDNKPGKHNNNLSGNELLLQLSTPKRK